MDDKSKYKCTDKEILFSMSNEDLLKEWDTMFELNGSSDDLLWEIATRWIREKESISVFIQRKKNVIDVVSEALKQALDDNYKMYG